MTDNHSENTTAALRSTFLYFAYGSNMLSRRLKHKSRCPSADYESTGFISGRQLTFDKVSKDGSGKCNIDEGATSARVYGVVFRIDCSEKSALDRAEGSGKGYDEKIVEVNTTDGKINAKTYVASRKVKGLFPYTWYKALVVAGAVEHRLPPDYVEWLRCFPCKVDYDDDRKERIEAEAILLGGQSMEELSED